MKNITRSALSFKVFIRQFLALIICLGISLTVAAHTTLHHSVPKANTELVSSPKTLELGFAKNVRLLKLNLFGPENSKVDFDFEAAKQVDKTFTYALPDLEQGEYRVEWSILGGDGHRISKEFSFTVKKAE